LDSKGPDSILGFITGPSRVKNEVGNRYGRLIVVARSPSDRRAHWFCRCDCGASAVVSGTNLRQGQQKSCGCLRVESAQRFHPRGWEEHPRWKGLDASYAAIHMWVRRHKQMTGTCTHCEEERRRTEWANVSGEYLRDLDDYIELCKSCHVKFDRRDVVAA